MGPNLTTCQLATWAENAVKFELKLSKKMEEKIKQKRIERGVRDNKNKCGKCE